MKNQSIFYLLLFITFVTSCKPAKDIAKEEELQEIKVPFSENKYQSNDEFYRAVGNFKSPNLNFAQQQARNSALQNMAVFIGNTTEQSAENFAEQYNYSDKSEFKQGVKQLGIVVAKQKMSNVKQIGVKTFKTKDNQFETFIALEMSVENYLKGLEASLENSKMQESSKEKLKNNWEEYKKQHKEAIKELENGQ